MTWDPKEKAHKAYLFADSFPTALVETGNWKDHVVVYGSERSVGAREIGLRSSTELLDGGRLASEAFSSATGSPEALVVSRRSREKVIGRCR